MKRRRLIWNTDLKGKYEKPFVLVINTKDRKLDCWIEDEEENVDKISKDS